MSSVEEMQLIALRLFHKGYIPLRIDPGSKAARHQGWQVETPSETSIERSFTRLSNLGVRCGDIRHDKTCLVAIDVDLDEPLLIEAVECAIGQVVPTKRGKKGATYFVRVDYEQKTGKLKYIRGEEKKDAIDILARGAQTVVPPSIHPDTKLEYQWIKGEPLWDVEYRQLPVFEMSLIDEIRGFCKNPDDLISALNYMEWAGVGGGGNTHDTCVSAVSCMVGRKWSDPAIHDRIQRAKREACERAGVEYNWPGSQKTIQEWIDSSREKKFDVSSKKSKKDLDEIGMDIINRFVYVAGIDRMWDLEKGSGYSMHVFNNIMWRQLPKAWTAVLSHPDFKIVDRLTYSPAEPRFCREQAADSVVVQDCLNLYTAPDTSPTEGNVQIFLDLVSHVFDKDAMACRHVLQFFAYAVQNPGARINHALVIQGAQGIGKDTIIQTMEKIFGYHNCGQVTLANIESQFNDWLFGRQMIVFQEMLATGRRSVYNKLKPYITDPMMSINIKHLAPQRYPNRAIYIFLTNYQHALSVDHGDRRTWVWYSKALPKSPEFYRRFYDWLADKRSVDALHHFFLNYDVGNFNPMAPPPITDAKIALMNSSANEVEQFLREAVESGAWPMGCDVVYIPHVQAALRGIMRASMSMITEALDNIAPGGMVEARPRFGAVRPRLRAIRDVPKWIDATADDLRKEYRMPLPPMQGESEGGYTVFNGENTSGDAATDRF